MTLKMDIQKSDFFNFLFFYSLFCFCLFYLFLLGILYISLLMYQQSWNKLAHSEKSAKVLTQVALEAGEP